VPARTTLMLGWWILLGSTAGLFVVVVVAAWWQRRRESPARARRRAERVEWARHALAVAARSQEAAAEVAQARAAADAAEQVRAEAWQRLEEAQAAHAVADRHYLTARQQAGAGPAPDPDGQRAIAGAALAAYRRGDLTGEQLWRVWRWGTGWDPELAARERELLRARAASREAHLAYRAVASRDRAATAALQVAEVQARALAEEAATAAAEAGWDGWEDVGDVDDDQPAPRPG